IQELTTLFELRCRQRGILWDCQLNFAQPCRLEGDPSKLRQVLINLLGNAVKFTEQGRISLVAHEISPGRFSFIVEDTGAGIEASALQDIFE
ncbi:ATP-binding protein, partial [Acinetobacter baumannii]